MQTKSSNKISPLSIVAGLGIACVFSLAIIFLGALLINQENVGESFITVLQIAAHFISTILGCFVTERLSETNKIPACGITGVSYFLIVLATASIFFDGVSGKFWLGIVSVLAALIVTSLWILRPQNNKARQRRKTAYR